jgi:membrane protein DedA with SNARE-associated domain
MARTNFMLPFGGLDSTIAVLVILTLLFIDEVGIPLPFAPSEVLLLLGGVLIRAGVLSAWVFLPAAAVAMTAGMLVGYGWSRYVGRPGLERLARRLHAQAVYQRMVARVEGAGPLPIGIARSIPGVRPWATLCCGAIGVGIRPFLLGALPALVLWAAGWITLGALVGLPAQRLLGAFHRILLWGSVSLVLGALGYAGVHYLRRYWQGNAQRRPQWLSAVFVTMAGAVVSVAAGLLAAGSDISGDDKATWFRTLLVVVVVATIAGITLFKNRRQHVRNVRP